MEAIYPYAIKNQRGASKKPLVGGFGCEELVLYGIRVVVKQLLGKVLDMEMDQTVSDCDEQHCVRCAARSSSSSVRRQPVR